MIDRESIKPPVAAAAGHPSQGGDDGKRLKLALVACAVVALMFLKPLYEWVKFALDSELFSHVILIPAISVYLVWPRRKELGMAGPPAWGAWALAWGAAVAVVATYWLMVSKGWKPREEDYLAASVLSLLLLLLGIAYAYWGSAKVRSLTFPIGFLAFMIPFPTIVRHWVEDFFQYFSADAAHAMLWLTGMPIYRSGTRFQLPGFLMEVAPECSGIHSSLVLFITSILAGQLFLKTPWKKTVLALAVIPLALLRNGLRITVIAQLCVQVNPDMIDSFIHRRGGPIFFALSLIPLFGLLVWLRKSEVKPAREKIGT